MSDKYVLIASEVMKQMVNHQPESVWTLIEDTAKAQGHTLTRTQKYIVRDVIAGVVRQLNHLEMAEA